MKFLKNPLALATTAAFLSFAAPPVHAQTALPEGAAGGGRLWFVELTGSPVADGNTLEAVIKEKNDFRRAAKTAKIQYSERRSFDVLFNGFSVNVDPRDRTKLQQLPGVKAIYPVELIQAPTPVLQAGAAPDLATAIAMTGADVAQNSLGLTGAGIKVAVMDTGIDIDHPDFGGNGSNGSTSFPTARVAYGYDFVGDDFDWYKTPEPDDSPDDCGGHGTHVAGIIGANGTVKGVAPGVTLGAYRVFGCEGSTTEDIMIAAMERALADGMQVLNMSIGGGFVWPQSPTAMAATRLVNKGMVVVASIGNSGASGLYSAGAPGLGEKVIGVASFDNVAVTLNQFTVSPDNAPVGYTPATGAPLPPTSGTQAMARTGTATTTNDACNAVAPAAGSLTGKVALIRRGSCYFYEKAFNAQNAGAIGVVLYNNVAGRITLNVAGTPAITIPVVSISDAEGVMIDGRLAAGAVDMTWSSSTGSFSAPNGGLISSFSSYGLSPDLSLKPDIGAPGGNIYSTYPLEKGGYASLSGTSMASPHVAGASALVLQAQPNTPAQAMRSLLQNSADPAVWSGNPGPGHLDNVHRQGAGMVDIDDAILATTRIEPGKISAGEGEAGPYTQRLTIVNKDAVPVTYDLSSVNALSTGGVVTPSFSSSDASVAFNAPSVTVPAGSTATVDATITPATGPVNGQYGGYIVFTPQGGGQVYRVPFAGFVGDYQGIQVLTPAAYGFPWLAKLNGGYFYKQPGGATFTMVGDDIPYFAIHLNHQSRRLRLEAFDAVTGKAWHRISDDEYLPRNDKANDFFDFAWDGTTFNVMGKNGSQWYTVPNGQYVVKLSVLKALGDKNNPAHWETWTSPVITIARP